MSSTRTAVSPSSGVPSSIAMRSTDVHTACAQAADTGVRSSSLVAVQATIMVVLRGTERSRVVAQLFWGWGVAAYTVLWPRRTMAPRPPCKSGQLIPQLGERSLRPDVANLEHLDAVQ